MADILILDGNPNPDALSGTLARSYAAGAASAGASVEVVHLAALDFDPILHRGYAEIQPLESDLVAMQRKIEHARHVVWIFPMWWVGLPALLKGFVDRVFLPGWAFSYDGGPMPTKLLTGRSARVIMTMDSPRWWYWLGYGRGVWRSFNIGTLWFSGFSPVKSTVFHGLHDMADEARARLPEKAETVGRRDGRRIVTSKAPQRLLSADPSRTAH